MCGQGRLHQQGHVPWESASPAAVYRGHHHHVALSPFSLALSLVPSRSLTHPLAHFPLFSFVPCLKCSWNQKYNDANQTANKQPTSNKKEKGKGKHTVSPPPHHPLSLSSTPPPFCFLISPPSLETLNSQGESQGCGLLCEERHKPGRCQPRHPQQPCLHQHQGHQAKGRGLCWWPDQRPAHRPVGKEEKGEREVEKKQTNKTAWLVHFPKRKGTGARCCFRLFGFWLLWCCLVLVVCGMCCGLCGRDDGCAETNKQRRHQARPQR